MKDLIFITDKSWGKTQSLEAGKNCNEQGNPLYGFYYKNRGRYRTVYRMNNGHVQLRYKFPKYEIPFKSNMHRWDNLFHVDATNETVIFDVIEGKKPMGFFCGHDDIVNELYSKIKGITSLPMNLTLAYPNAIDTKELGISNDGILNELFDIDKLIESYRLMAEGNYWKDEFLSIKEEKEIRKYTNNELSQFFTYDYANPKNKVETIITGLILGYPLESTYALLTMNIR